MRFRIEMSERDTRRRKVKGAKETKEMKFEEFIAKLQTKSNSFFSKINIESFTGTIVFTKRIKADKSYVEIELQEDGRTF